MLGPGLITGASDDDPSGIATYSQVGAQFGYSMTWVMLFTWPLMAAIQEISARIGRVTGHGIAGNIRRYYPPWLLRAIVALLLAANVINLGADLGAMGEALRLLSAARRISMSSSLRSAARSSKFLCATSAMSRSSNGRASRCSPTSRLHWWWMCRGVGSPTTSSCPPSAGTRITSSAIVAVLGTTISPYCFFWQSSQEAEDERVDPAAHALIEAPEEASSEINRIRIDTYLGMGFSNVIASSSSSPPRRR